MDANTNFARQSPSPVVLTISNPVVIVSLSFFIVSMLFAVLCWIRYRESSRSPGMHGRLQKRAESLAWISWSNLSLQAFVVALGLSIANKDTIVGIAIMVGFIVAILAVGYRYALRMTFFVSARADAAFILSRRELSEGKTGLNDWIPRETEPFARLVNVLSPDAKLDSEARTSSPLLELIQKLSASQKD